MLSPICPHICEEIWQILGHNETIAYEPWVTWDDAKCVETQIEIAVQVNGKIKDRITVDAEISQEDALAAAKELEKVKSSIEGMSIVKEFYVKGKLVNIVVKPA
jgi:leucyl-tRNA synthetase